VGLLSNDPVILACFAASVLLMVGAWFQRRR
jgi:hypothetical protein